MKLLVGLGNPGRRYAGTRHNVGFRVLESFSRAHHLTLDSERFGGRFGRGRVSAPDADVVDVGLLEPQTYMNLSGDSVAEALAMLPVGDSAEDLLVVVDDVDLPFGRLRVRPSGGSGGHRGLAHIIERLQRKGFSRLRFGVGRPAGPIETADHVLMGFSEEEEQALPAHLERAVAALESFLFEGPERVMNRFNPDPPSEV